MGGYHSVFKRVEKKYRIDPAQRRAVEAAAAACMVVDAYGRTRITSLYLDTPDRAMIARSVEKPLYKEKLRLRAYGEAAGQALMATFMAGPVVRSLGEPPLSEAVVEARAHAGCSMAGLTDPLAVTVFFGIKKKFKGIVYKRRLALSLPAALAFVSGMAYEVATTRWPVADPGQAFEALNAQTRQIARELEAAMGRAVPLVPSMGIACDREAWAVRETLLPDGASGGHADDLVDASFAPDCAPRSASGHPVAAAPAAAADPTSALFDPELRLTFDDRLEYWDCCQPQAGWCPIIAPRESILEIKSAGPYPRWLVTALSAHAVYPASFTKYGNAYQMCALNIPA